MRMKRFWWSWILVFLLGLGVGRLAVPEYMLPDTDSPSFSQPPASLEATRPAPTEPTVIQVGGSQQGDLPQALQYTSLVARDLVGYDGPYLEDGSEEELIGVAALLLENTGSIGIEFAQIIVAQEGRELVFDATYIPPRSTVLVLEKNRRAFFRDPVESVRCRTLIPGSFDWAKDSILTEPGEGFSLQVTNLTDRSFRFVRVFYKQFDGPEDLLIGGITFSAVIPDLAPGETRVITPYRYANGYSSIVAVVTEE